ncbi:MAG: response regulator [Lachnospiraceae bacterium]|nr:response regulator [Lachnospiraceae bacterium]
MQTLLIVEDEKMIRQGIAVMAKRTNVPIGQILECRNGLEALELIRQGKIDAMFTDIKMPKMDGIALVEAMQECKYIPQTAVISGYDDFNYAVEMLKNGVIDYVLKPVKREKIQEVLQKMEANIAQAQQQKENGKRILFHHLNMLLEGKELGSKEKEALAKAVKENLGTSDYRMAMAGCDAKRLAAILPQELMLEAGRQQSVIILAETRCPQALEQIEEMLKHEQIGFAAGETIYHSLDDMKPGLEEVWQLRSRSFVCGRKERDASQEHLEIPEGFAEKFVRQFPTERLETAQRELHNLYFQGQHGRYDAQEILELIRAIWKGLELNYPDVMDTRREPLEFLKLDDWIAYEDQQFTQMKRLLRAHMDVDRNQEKVYLAIEYIKNHYATDLNMATVSNHVSMNYSLFSIVFKEYTGVNFVNYLKNIRISEAKRLLEQTDDKIQDISRKVGYENEKHFMKTFKAISGVSPTEYRKLHSCM